MNLTLHSIFPKRFDWLCLIPIVVFLVIVLLYFCFLYTPKSNVQCVTELTQPIVALSFDPNSSEINPTGGWLYNIANGELLDLGDTPEVVCDFDSERDTLLGIHEGMVTEAGVQDGSRLSKGAAEYEGSAFVSHTLQYRPQSRDYSALTKSGILVLWEEKTTAYRELARFDWYEYAFAYSWLEDGKRVCIPDQNGIGILDTDTLVQEHWLTVDITYSDGGPLPPTCKRPFVVSPKGDFVVFCGGTAKDKMMISFIDGEGELQSPEPLTDARSDGRCWFDISPDGKSVIYGLAAQKNTLFNPTYYEVWLYHAGERYRLFESKESTNPGIGIYW